MRRTAVLAVWGSQANPGTRGAVVESANFGLKTDGRAVKAMKIGDPVLGVQPTDMPVVPDWAKRSTATRATEDTRQYTPPLRRQWAQGPISPLSTVATRKDHFRVLQFNMLADSWSLHEDMRDKSSEHLSLVSAPAAVPVDIKVRDDGGEEMDMPPAMRQDFRCNHLRNEIQFHDPDVFAINEVSQIDYRQHIWRDLRRLGYGLMFVSSIRKKDLGKNVIPWHKDVTNDKDMKRYPDALLPSQDVGTVIGYHKGRFVPLQQAGVEFPGDLPYIHMCGLRDRITSMTLFVSGVQLKPGRGKEAEALRELESKKIMDIMRSMKTHGMETEHGCHMVMGDLSTLDIEEPCVNSFRKNFSSAYDIVGGPRWTAWYHERRGDPVAEETEKTKTDEKAPKQLEAPRKKVWSSSWDYASEEDEDTSRQLSTEGSNALSLTSDQILAKMKEDDALMERRGIVKATSDFIFYDSQKMSVLRVLDMPKESEVDPVTLFPNEKNPSHHVSLVADVCFNNHYPNKHR